MNSIYRSVCAIAIISGASLSAQNTLKQRPAQVPVLSPPPAVNTQTETTTPAAEKFDIIPAGVPLRVEIDHTYPLKAGTRIEGHLIAPIYLVDHQVLPVNSRISGFIANTHPVPNNIRTNAMLDGDFTPLAVPNVQFDTLTLPNGTQLKIQAQGTERTAGVVRMSSKTARPSMKEQAVDQVRQSKNDVLDTLTKPGKADRAKRFLYSQLPYHPQRIWRGTEYDADLTAPVVLPGPAPAPLPVQELKGTPTGRVEARLAQQIDSRNARKGDPVQAVLTRPLLAQPGSPGSEEVLLPEGTRLEGSVLQARPAKWFARNGKLRFTFREIELLEGSQRTEVHGQISAAEASSSENLSIDAEGGAKANPDKGKYLAPLALGVLAAASMDDDGNLAATGAVTSNGFGLVARVVGIAAASPPVSMGFAYFALTKSVCRRWIAKGKEVNFPKDTRLQIDLTPR